MPDYFSKYIIQVDDIELMDAFAISLQQLKSQDQKMLESLGEKTYAPGKWPVRDVLLHITDTERVFAYRALRFARADKTPLAGFDQDDYVTNGNARLRSIADLMEELILVRKTSIALFKDLSPEALMRTGISNGKEISVLALGFTIIGHQLHHWKILNDKYLPLV